MAKIVFFETNEEQQEYIKRKLAGQDYEPIFTQDKFSLGFLKNHSEAEAISVFVGSRVQAEDLTEFSNLKLVTTRSTGFDHLDIGGLSGKGIRLGYVPGYGDNTVAEFAFGLLLAVVRKVCKANARIRNEGSFSIEGFQGFDLLNKTIGIIGTGRIGRHMIRIANGFGMKVVAYDLHPNPELEKELNFKYVSLDELLRGADAISLHVPYCADTHHLLDAQAFAKVKPGAILVNTARGAVVDTTALLKALRDGQLGGAGVDVLEGEEQITDELSFILYNKQEQEDVRTLAENLILVDLPNVVVTPHIAFYTQEALHRILDSDLENIDSFFKKGVPTYDILASRRVSSETVVSPTSSAKVDSEEPSTSSASPTSASADAPEEPSTSSASPTSASADAPEEPSTSSASSPRGGDK